MRSDEAFLIANKVAAPFSLIGGVLFIISGAVAAAVPLRTAAVALPTGVVIAGVVMVIGGAKGVRAARAMR
jgi:hypothetical protein